MSYLDDYYKPAFHAAAVLGDIPLDTLMQAYDEFTALVDAGAAIRKLHEPLKRVFPDPHWKFKPYTDALAFMGSADTHRMHLDALANTIVRKTMLLHMQGQLNESSVPYLRFSAITDNQTPPACLAKHGSIYRKNSPAWKEHHPLGCEFANCRCTVTGVFDFDLVDKGWKALD